MARILPTALLGFIALLAAGCLGPSKPPPLSSPLQLWWNGGGEGYAARASSYDRTGANKDAIRLLPGETATLADLAGSGVIRHIWMTTSETAPAGRTLVLRFYWDGAETPAVEVPYGDFFGVGNGLDANVSSYPITVGSQGRARNCWWPMPFASGARITLTNDGARPVAAFYYYIDYLSLDVPPATPERFHARYRQAYPAEGTENYPILDTTGTGHYVGTVFSVESTKPQWWGEGDDVIAADDREPLRGTGTEDYFCDAWGMREQLMLWHGTPVCEGYDDAGKRTSMYRFHIVDPIPFKKRLSVSIEHGTQNDRADNLSSVAFWYQTPPASSAPPFPPVFERLLGDNRAEMIRHEAWRLAFDPTEESKVELGRLAARTWMPEDRILVEGMILYAKGTADPSDASLRAVDGKLAELNALIDSIPPEKRYSQPVLDLPTDNDDPVPGPVLKARETLERGRHDLARRAALARGLRPGDEIVVESRDANGRVVPAPTYEDSPDFADSYAKVADPHTLGSGARFTYGKAASSHARFTPSFPSDGRYEALVIFSYGSNAGNTRYEIHHADGLATVDFPQKGRPGTEGRNSGVWLSLGTYRFKAGQDASNGSVLLRAESEAALPNPEFEYRAYADAVRFVYRGE